jgi:four helix bundle protein
MREEIINRFLKFNVEVYRLEKSLCKTFSGRHVFGQMFRSSTSAGANYDEATSAESKQDFIHKMQLFLKELRETYFWLRFVDMADMISENANYLKPVLQENQELLNIIGKSVKTAKLNKTIKK